jgi:CrcB protein
LKRLVLIKNLIAVFSLGALGAILRSFFLYMPQANPMDFPFFTLLINITGSFIIGLVAAPAVKKRVSSDLLQLSITVGFLGGLTTFSTFCKEIYNLLSSGKYVICGVYICISIIFGLYAAMLGNKLGDYTKQNEIAATLERANNIEE